MSEHGLAVEAALLFLAKLGSETQARVRRRLAIRLMPEGSPKERREHELGLVADLLDGVTPRLGWSFPCVARKEYDAARREGFPSSTSLVSRYGSWVDVCRHAHDLHLRRVGAVERLRRGPVGSAVPGRRYDERDATAALRACAVELQRAPSKQAYHYWRAAAVHRRRRPGIYPSAGTISVLYMQRGGWRAALEDAQLVAAPAATVRVVVASSHEASALVEKVRSRGLVAAHGGGTRYLEARGTAAELRRAIVASAEELCLETVALWEPCTSRLEVIGPLPLAVLGGSGTRGRGRADRAKALKARPDTPPGMPCEGSQPPSLNWRRPQ